MLTVSRTHYHGFWFALCAASTWTTGASAQSPPSKAIIAVVGDAERLNIGQSGYCGNRTEIDRPSNVQFQVPPDKQTYFYIKASFRVPTGHYYCEGDYSFVPQAGKLHIIRYSFLESACRLELFAGTPGATPVPAAFEREERRSCAPQ